MEFVFVDFPTARRVDMDGQGFGTTNRTLTCPSGHHTFDLNVPVNYTPVSQNVNVTGTTATTPLHVLFRPAATALIEVPTAAAARSLAPTAGRKKARKRKAGKKARKTTRRKTSKRRKTR